MIGKLQGNVDFIGDTYAIIMCSGVGYRVFCPYGVLSGLKIGTVANLWIETNVREDHIHLFGFESRSSQDLFLKLTTVSGVGPRVGMAIMGAMNTNILLSAIASGDIKTLTSAPGVGKKVAERIIVELKGKVSNIMPNSGALVGCDSSEPFPSACGHSNYNDLLSALEALGYRRVDVIELAQKIARENPDADTGTLVRLALKAV